MPRRTYCLDCYQPCTGTRCTDCAATRDRDRHARRTHYQGDYKTRRAELRKQSEASDAPCWLCLEPIDYTLPGTHPLGFSADHLTPGHPASPLMPSHRRCNESRGNRA